MIFIHEHKNRDDQVVNSIRMETHEEALYSILEDFEAFIRGCGFHFDGHLTIEEESKYE